MEDEMAEETRVLKRRHLIFYLEVYDDASGELLGHVVDITTKGMKIISHAEVPINRMFRLRMMLPEGYFDDHFIHFEARSLWSANDVNPDFFDTGFEVPFMDVEARKTILKLIHETGFNDQD